MKYFVYVKDNKYYNGTKLWFYTISDRLNAAGICASGNYVLKQSLIA
jgi:hypothetical protein